MDFPSPVFQTVDRLTLRSVPELDFRTPVPATFVGTKKLVKRREFEEYISQKLVI